MVGCPFFSVYEGVRASVFGAALPVGEWGVLCYQYVGFCGIDLIEWGVNKLLTNSDWDGCL